MGVRTLTIAMLLVAALLAPAASAQSSPGEGPGGPILVVVDPGDAFGRYYAEILRAEGLNEFAVTTKSNLNAATLNAYQVVLLAQTSLDATQVATLTTWVNNGGNLIAMRPDGADTAADNQLNALLGVGSDTGNLANGYIGVAGGTPPGAGITTETMQFHGTADRRAAAGATTVATLYSDANSPTSDAAVTLRSHGPAGGQVATFTYDLARSVVYTRQGNPDWAGQERDGQDDVIRSDDMFFPDWVDFDRIRIPQADEQQRLLANLITQMNFDRTPLPRFWYLPRGEKAAVVLTGDDHANGGTVGQFTSYQNDFSPTGCSVANWQCVRSTSYVYRDTPISPLQAQAFQAAGFEIAVHLFTECHSFTPASLEADWVDQLGQFDDKWPGLNAPRTNRTHCIVWNDWAGEPKAEAAHGVRLDTNYYYWPAAWVQDRPGMFTGSGFPMRFADLDGSLIDVYQATTQLTDESEIDVRAHIQTLLDGALGSDGYYGVFTANMHTDGAEHPGAIAIIQEAQARGVPVVSAVQMLDWLDGRNGSSFQNMSFSAGRLQFNVVRGGAGANGLEAMLPVSAATGALTELRRNGVPVSTTQRTVKGIDYAVFDAAAGTYVAAYGPGDATPPDTTITGATLTAGGASFTFSSDDPGAHFECQVDGGAFNACTTPAQYSGLADGSHTFSVQAVDVAGNVDPTPASRAFVTTGGATTGGASTGGGSGAGAGSGSGAKVTPGATASLDRSGPRVKIVTRRVRASAKGLLKLRVTCPSGEQRCRIDLRLRRGSRQLVGKMLTIAGGKSATVTLRLTRDDRLRLVRVRSLLVDAAAIARDVAGNRATTTTRIRLLAPKRR